MAEADGHLFINRELSWLAFNERVLEEGADPTIPLLERLKFAAIAASNLDEFFMVRVAGLRRAGEDGNAYTDPAGLTPARQLAAVCARARTFVEALHALVGDHLLPALAMRGVRLLTCCDLDEVARASLGAYFSDSVLPVLTPLAADASRRFPLLSSLSLNLVVLLDAAAPDPAHRLAVVQVPGGLPRLVPVRASDGMTFVLLEDVIRMSLPQLFPGQTILEASCVRLTRDAELELDDERGHTHLEVVERELRQRRRRDVVRIEVEATASEELVSAVRGRLGVGRANVYAVRGPLDLRVLMTLVELPGFEELRYPPLRPMNALGSHASDLFAVLEERDVLLHHPYDAYDPVIALVSQAADDPDVLAIKQTLYRVSAGSPIIRSLQRAAERNKQVTVVVELKARFDEERNIRWARALEEAGAHVIHGIRGYKVHAKICLVVKRTGHGLRRYVHLGTGNYNERTARSYTDFGLLTSSAPIAEDTSAFFSALTGYSDPPRLKKLVMAPTRLRQRLLALIAGERRRAEAGQPAEIVAKMNALVDREIIEALYAAARVGVRIRLNVRGVCALRPGVAGVSDGIEVVSIVDRFLEHSRVFYFLSGGREDVYLASADWMTRNLDRRIELMFPVEAVEPKSKVLHALRAMFRDNVKSRWLRDDGSYRRSAPVEGEAVYRVQEELQQDAMRGASVLPAPAGVVFQPQRRRS